MELLFGLISAAALGFCRHLWKQNKKLQELQTAEQKREYRQMIVDEIEPLIEELRRAEDEIKSMRETGVQTIKQIEKDETKHHKDMYDDLEKIQKENERKFAIILNSYKYRLIQLCRFHLREGFISQPDYDQVSEMHSIYVSLGGNGQAEEYFEKVKDLKDKPQ